MIIIEGTDKAGKTTLLTNLKRFFPRQTRQELQIIHFGLLPDNWDYNDDYLRYIRSNVILDRFIDSERAYGPVYRNNINPRLSFKKMSNVYRRCAEIGTLVLYCNPDIEEVMRRIDLEGDEMVNKREQLESLRFQFDNIFNDDYPLDFITIDTTSSIKDETYNKIVNKSLILERSAKQLINLNYRGSVVPLSKYIIYTHHNTSDILSWLSGTCSIPSTSFSIIQSRDIENKPVNISSLALSLTSLKSVFVIEAEEDYKNANNKNAYCNVPKYKDLINVLSEIEN